MMRWAIAPALVFGLLFSPSLRADPSANTARAKYLDGSLDADALSQARERARQICLQGAGPEQLPAQSSPRFLTYDAPKGTPAGVVHAWAVPDSRSREHRALVLAAGILKGDSEASLSQELVAKRRLASGVTAGLLGQSGVDLFVVQVSGAQSVHLEEISSKVALLVERLATQGPESAELERAKIALEAEIAAQVGAEVDASQFTSAYREVSAAEVRTAIRTYLTASRRTTVEIRPRGSPEPWVPNPADIVRPPFRLHTMKKGETLVAVARRHGVSEKAVAKANSLGPKPSPYVGQTLKIPQQPKPKREAGSQAVRGQRVTPKVAGANRASVERQTAKRPLARKKR